MTPSRLLAHLLALPVREVAHLLVAVLRDLDPEPLSHAELRALQQALLGLDDRIIRAKARRPSASSERMEAA